MTTEKISADSLEAKARAHRASAEWFRRLKLNSSADFEEKLARKCEAKAANIKKKGGQNGNT